MPQGEQLKASDIAGYHKALKQSELDTERRRALTRERDAFRQAGLTAALIRCEKRDTQSGHREELTSVDVFNITRFDL